MKSGALIKKIILPIKRDDRGFLVYGEANNQLPFEIKRVFYIGDVESGGNRGHHAHKENILALFCIQGKSLIKLDNGTDKAEVWLDSPNEGLLINPLIWHSMEEFSKDTILLCLASLPYNESDYLRDYEDFKIHIKKG